MATELFFYFGSFLNHKGHACYMLCAQLVSNYFTVGCFSKATQNSESAHEKILELTHSP